MVRRRWWGGAAVLLVLAGSCGEVRLVDPRVEGVPASGVLVEVGVHGWGGGTRLEFQGYVYGYEQRGGGGVLRYLDAGQMLVAGWIAERVFIRIGEPIYRVAAYGPVVRPRVQIRISGSDAVAGCAFEVVIPVVSAPADGAVLRRDRGLELPLDSFVAETVPGSRVRARVVVEDSAGQRHRFDPVPGAVLVVPTDFLSRVPEGGAELSVRIDLERNTDEAGGATACAPALLARTWYQQRAVVRFE